MDNLLLSLSGGDDLFGFLRDFFPLLSVPEIGILMCILVLNITDSYVVDSPQSEIPLQLYITYHPQEFLKGHPICLVFHDCPLDISPQT